MAAPFPSSDRMDAWPERRGLQTMNLRSVFTAEQQRILERYYENGMTNQSKACFQLILQCAQETKLDFSVVRTWVGNKRRKLASKADQNGGMSHSISSQGLAGGLLPNHTLAGGGLSNQSLAGGALVAGAMLTAEMSAARNIQNRAHLLPPSSSFPSSASSSSSPSSSSPLSTGNSNNNDVILTGIYSLNAPRSRPRHTIANLSDTEPSTHSHSSLLNQSLHRRSSSGSSPLHSKLVSVPRKPPSMTSSSGPSVHAAARKRGLSLGELGSGSGSGTGMVPHSWARQYGAVQARPWTSSSQSQLQMLPNSNPPQPAQPPPRPRVSVPIPLSNPDPSSDHTPRIQQVFTLSERPEGERLKSGSFSIRKSQESHRPVHHPLDAGGYFSIAMETGDEEDEWQREEELSLMAAQNHVHRAQTSASPLRVESSEMKGGNTPMNSSRPSPHHSNTALHGSYSVTPPTSLKGESSSQTSISVSAAPWLLNSRKRTLQDRTQFSDGDLIQLKRYWDRGMTSLGSVCRMKIADAANRLNVDTEIVKTWISNRRRKYRLMGIEIPPPKSGPAFFMTSSPGNESPLALSPDEDGLGTPEPGDDLTDGGSICLSEDGTNDSYQRDGEDGSNGSNSVPLANNVKIEIIDNEDDDGEIVASTMEQMQSLLEFKHEEVQFLEHELVNQKQKYHELESFTRSLLCAIRNNDLGKQQELMASLPQPADQDWNMTPARGVESVASSNHDDSSMTASNESNEEPSLVTANKDFPLGIINTDSSAAQVTEPSASEEPLEAITEHV